MAAGDGIDVEELLAQLRVGPEAVALVGGHVVGDDVEHDPHSGGPRVGGQGAETLLATEGIRELPRIDDVIAVGGPGTRLQRGAEIEVRDAEVTQVGHQRPRRGEVEVRRELQPVGGPKLTPAAGQDAFA